MKRLTNYGFTLIELLVVIAIIGILAAVVLTSLGGAQEGAQNSNVQQTLGSVRSSAQLWYNENNFAYSNLCTDANAEVPASLQGLADNLAFINDFNTGDPDDIVCNDSATAYAVQSPLLNADTAYWCVDSTGAQGGVDTALGTDTECPST